MYKNSVRAYKWTRKKVKFRGKNNQIVIVVAIVKENVPWDLILSLVLSFVHSHCIIINSCFVCIISLPSKKLTKVIYYHSNATSHWSVCSSKHSQKKSSEFIQMDQLVEQITFYTLTCQKKKKKLKPIKKIVTNFRCFCSKQKKRKHQKECPSLELEFLHFPFVCVHVENQNLSHK